MGQGRGTLNRVMLIGRLGSDPELKYTPSGRANTTISVATNRHWKSQDGTPQEKTEWHRIVAWSKLAEVVGEYLKKGSNVYIEGRLQTRSWDDDSGNKRYITEIVMEDMEMLGSSGYNQQSAGGGGGGGGGGEMPAMPDEEDDLPF